MIGEISLWNIYLKVDILIQIYLATYMCYHF